MANKSATKNASSAPALPAYVANKNSQFSFLTGPDFPEKHNIAWRIEIAREEAANPLFEPKYPGRGLDCELRNGAADPTGKTVLVEVDVHKHNHIAAIRLGVLTDSAVIDEPEQLVSAFVAAIDDLRCGAAR